MVKEHSPACEFDKHLSQEAFDVPKSAFEAPIRASATGVNRVSKAASPTLPQRLAASLCPLAPLRSSIQVSMSGQTLRQAVDPTNAPPS